MMLPLVPVYIIVAFSGFHTRKANMFCFKGAPCLHEAVLTQIARIGSVSCDLRQGLYGKCPLLLGAHVRRPWAHPHMQRPSASSFDMLLVCNCPLCNNAPLLTMEARVCGFPHGYRPPPANCRHLQIMQAYVIAHATISTCFGWHHQYLANLQGRMRQWSMSTLFFYHRRAMMQSCYAISLIVMLRQARPTHFL